MEPRKLRCIYCLKDKNPSDFQKREHVIPQGFGLFTPDNLILRELVCDECNQYFGDHLELYLGRDSFESFERSRHGFKAKEPLRKRRRVKSKIRSGEFKGVLVREIAGNKIGSLLAEKLVQVGFHNKEKGEYDFFEIGDIPHLDELLERGYDVKDSTIYLIGYEDEIKLLEKELVEKGFTLKYESKFIKNIDPSGKVEVVTELTSDRVIMRGICKIAFNYLAHIAPKHFIFNHNLNLIRQFIRYNDGDSEKFISYNLPPILYDDQKLKKFGRKVTIGHLITLEWDQHNIVSKISLFNSHTYGVTLCKNYDGIWIPLRYGHHFDIETKQVSKLLVLNRRFIP
jgi:hypothetical protein